MPFALTIIGLIMIVSGARDTHAALGKEVVADATDFLPWIVSIGGIGMVGYIPQLRTFSRAFMALIFIVMVLRNGGFFDKFNEALALGPVRPGDEAKDITPSPVSALNDAADNVKKVLGTFDPAAYTNDAKENFAKFMDILKIFI